MEWPIHEINEIRAHDDVARCEYADDGETIRIVFRDGSDLDDLDAASDRAAVGALLAYLRMEREAYLPGTTITLRAVRRRSADWDDVDAAMLTQPWTVAAAVEIVADNGWTFDD